MFITRLGKPPHAQPPQAPSAAQGSLPSANFQAQTGKGLFAPTAWLESWLLLQDQLALGAINSQVAECTGVGDSSSSDHPDLQG